MCGLCCDGGIFLDVPLTGDEVDRLARHGKICRDEGGNTATLAQPCQFHAAGACTIYSDRPARCRTFHCLLLNRYLAGESSQPEAQALISRALQLRQELETLLRQKVSGGGDAGVEQLFAQFADERLNEADADDAADDKIALLYVEYITWLRRHFVSGTA